MNRNGSTWCDWCLAESTLHNRWTRARWQFQKTTTRATITPFSLGIAEPKHVDDERIGGKK